MSTEGTSVRAFGYWETRKEGGAWEIAPPYIAEQFEMAYALRRSEVTVEIGTAQGALREGDADVLHYKVDFGSMTQICLEHPGRKRDVRRVKQDVELTDSQRKAVSYVSARCHSDVTKHVRSLQAILGTDAYWRLHAAMMYTVPLIIHTKLTGDVMGYYLRDTHYRNFFETRTGRGSTMEDSRTGWERTSFGDAFRGADAAERPKYGCINMTNDPKGVKRVAQQYGTSFFVMKPALRWRCTFSQFDTCRESGNAPATSYQFARFLDDVNVFTEDDLELIARQKGGQLSDGSYREVQFHGPIRFAQDIALIVASDEIPAADRKLVQDFAEKNSIPLEWRELWPNLTDAL